MLSFGGMQGLIKMLMDNSSQKPHPNLQIIGKFFEAYGHNDQKAISEILAEDIQWHIPGNHPLSGTKTGSHEVLAFFKKLEKGAFKASPIATGVNGEYVIDCHKNWSELEGDHQFEGMSCLLWRIQNGKIKEVHNFPEDQNVVDSFFNKVYG